MTYPTALDTAATLYDLVNNLTTTVGTAYTSPATSLVLADASAFPASGNIIYVGGERGLYTGKSSNTLTGVSGLGNNHNAGEAVSLFFDAAHHNTIRDAIIALETLLGIANSADTNSIDYIAKHKPDLASANPVALGTAAPGTGSTAARNDHVHPTTGLELTANKATGFGTVNDTLYPTVQAVKTYADGLVVGLLDDRGSYNASGNAWPSSGGSGTAGAILKGDLWYISVAGTLGGTAVSVGDTIRALVDTPGSTASNWSVLEVNMGYVPENAANKDVSAGYVGKTLEKINFWNTARSFMSFLVNAATAARTYTFQDRDGTIADLGANTFTGDQTLGNNNLKTIKTATFNSEATQATTTGAATVDWTAAQNYKQTEPTGAITYTFTAPPGVCHLQLRILSDGASTAYTHVFPGTVKWVGATWAAVANKNAVLNFWWDGTNYWAMGSNEV